jgi:hypothetical protein
MEPTTTASGIAHGFDPYSIAWVLLLNAILVWTPTIIFITRKLGRLETIGEVVDRYRIDKVSERLNTIENLGYNLRDSLVGIPARVIAQEECTRNLKTSLGDGPSRVVALEVQTTRINRQLQDHPARVTALEVLTERMQQDTQGLPARTIAVEVITKRLQEELLIIPSKVIAIELFQENMKGMQEKIIDKLETLESEHLRNMGRCGKMETGKP